MSSGDRTAILDRIREALREPAPRHHEKPESPPPPGVTAPFREWLPTVGASDAERVAVFARLSEMLKTEFVDCSDLEMAARHLNRLAQEHGWKRVAIHRGLVIDAVCGRTGWQDSPAVLPIEPGYDRHALEACEAGVTECECLVAQTGSVCVTTRSSGGRALSVLPPHHVVVARRDQIVPDLTAAYELLARRYAAGGYPSFVGFITGPSRTGDIERILVLGAHGPKKLTVLLVP